jgi:hypothetical protein
VEEKVNKPFWQDYQMPVYTLVRQEDAQIAKELGNIVSNLAKMPASYAYTLPLDKLWEKLKYGDFYCYCCNNKIEEKGYCIEIPDIDLKKEAYCIKCGQKEVFNIMAKNNIEKISGNPLKGYNLGQLKKIKELWPNLGIKNNRKSEK